MEGFLKICLEILTGTCFYFIFAGAVIYVPFYILHLGQCPLSLDVVLWKCEIWRCIWLRFGYEAYIAVENLQLIGLI